VYVIINDYFLASYRFLPYLKINNIEITDVNYPFLDLTGLSKEEALGHNADRIFLKIFKRDITIFELKKMGEQALFLFTKDFRLV
jgi:hypothetical protein